MFADPLRLRVIWNNQIPVTPFMGFRDLHVNPEPSFPFGRKGLCLIRAWEELGPPNGAPGMLILDGDVAIDPHDSKVMHECIYTNTECIWVAPVRLWPVSHLGQEWTWGHGKNGQFTQDDIDDPEMFSFSFTYLPDILCDALGPAGACDWAYPQVDLFTWELAANMGIKAQVVRNCYPKHMHW